MEEIGAHPRAASTARTERRRRRGRGRRERKSKGRGTSSVTPRTGRKTGTNVTEGTSRSIMGWIGLGPPPEPDARVAAPHGQPVLVEEKEYDMHIHRLQKGEKESHSGSFLFHFAVYISVCVLLYFPNHLNHYLLNEAEETICGQSND
jgi:hypothetical protein